MVSLWSDTDRGVEVTRLEQADEIAPLLTLFEQIASEEGWQPGDGLQQSKSRSTYFAIYRHGQLLGGLQLVVPDVFGTLPCHKVWPEVRPISEPRRNAHIAVLALDSASRGEGMLFWLLGIEMWRHCVAAGIANLFIEVTPRVLPLYRRLGWPLETVGELRTHWGEGCYLCAMDTAEVTAALVRRAANSPGYQQVVLQAFRMAPPPLAQYQHGQRQPWGMIREPAAVYTPYH